jgi:cation diffusion facilitator CzcD-associated flavoprotein CzcO
LWQTIIAGDRWRLEPGPQRAAMEREYASYLECIADPDLRAKLTPDYNLGCTRIPKSDRNYYQAVQLPNAHIVKGEIARIVADGVVMTDGSEVPLDVLVYATGFDAHAYMRPMQVIGLGRATLDAVWRERVYSWGGIALPGFPNLFMLYGPFSPVNNVPVPLGLEQEIGCIMRLIAEARARRAVVAPTTAATEKFLARLDAAFPAPCGSAGAGTGMPTRPARRSCGRCRKAPTRCFSKGWHSRISSSSRPERGIELGAVGQERSRKLSTSERQRAGRPVRA